MIGDARKLDARASLETAVCIIGGGAAGITLATTLDRLGIPTIVLESGGFDRDENNQQLYEGKATGLAPNVLSLGRLRYFGGSTNHWAGMVAPLDHQDFETRPWVPESGWPISYEDLVPYYVRSSHMLDMVKPGASAEFWKEDLSAFEPLARQGIEPKPIGIRVARFGRRYRARLERSDSVSVLLHANADQIVAADNGRSISRVDVKTLEGSAFSVHARAYVVACGGIENARLLLSSNRVLAKGLGNDHDLVGRFYMDHASAATGATLVWLPAAKPVYPRMNERRLGFGFAPSVLAEQEMLNIVLYAGPPRPASKLARALRVEAEIVARLGGPEKALASVWRLRSEQQPVADSRVRLGTDLDALGKPRVVVDARLGELNRSTFLKAVDLYARAFAQSGFGRMRIPEDMRNAEPDWRGRFGTDHQMGTTRMAASPKHGVVDADQKVFGISNLYVAGSSVFPTGGFMNPTFTIVALTLRLGDHLATRLA